MVHADHPRRSRIGWPTRRPPQPLRDVPEHRHRTDRRQWVAIVGLYVVVALNSYLQILDHQYVMGRGQYRDAERAADQAANAEQLRLFACELLDGLPAGPLFDPKRAHYGCGPGVPIDQLPPDVQANLGELRGAQSEPGGEMARPAPGESPELASEDPPVGTPAIPVPASPGSDPSVTPPTPASTSPAAPSTPGPAVDLSPLTDTVCDLLGVCF